MALQRDQETLFAAMAEGLTSPAAAARLQRLEIALGVLGFFTFVGVLTAGAAQLRGQPAVFEAIVAGVLVAMTWTVHRRWRQLGASVEADVARRRGRNPGS